MKRVRQALVALLVIIAPLTALGGQPECGKAGTFVRAAASAAAMAAGGAAGAKAGAVLGAKIGATCDLAAGGATFGVCTVIGAALGGLTGFFTGLKTADVIDGTKNCAGSVWRTLDRSYWYVDRNRNSQRKARTVAERKCESKGKGECVEELTFRYCAAPAYGRNDSGQKRYFWAQAGDAVTAGDAALQRCVTSGLKECKRYKHTYCNLS